MFSLSGNILETELEGTWLPRVAVKILFILYLEEALSTLIACQNWPELSSKTVGR